MSGVKGKSGGPRSNSGPRKLKKITLRVGDKARFFMAREYKIVSVTRRTDVNGANWYDVEWVNCKDTTSKFSQSILGGV